MILLVLIALGMFAFAVFTMEEAGLFGIKRMKRFDAVLIDEVEDEIYDNTGTTKTRFFKTYEYFDGKESCVVRSEKPMRRITDKVGRKCVIFVGQKSRKALEKSDLVYFILKVSILMLLGVGIIAVYFYLRNYVPGAAL